MRAKKRYGLAIEVRCGTHYDTGDARTQIAHWSTGLYHDLHRRAAAYLACQPPGGSMEASDLVHEAWLRLAANKQHWQSRAHFLAAAASTMRCVLIDQARRAATVRHGAAWRRVELTGHELADGMPDDWSLAIDDVLDQFTVHHAAESELVKLRYFDGLTLKEAAEALGITHATAKRYWTYSKAWLCRELQKQAHKPAAPSA